MATSLAAAPKAATDKAKTGKRDTDQPKGAKKSKKKLIVIVGLVLVVAGAAAWFFLLRAPKSAEVKKPEPGVVVKLDPISINLADGHFLKVGLALQATAVAHELDGSQALDIAIAELSGREMGELAKAKEREKVKKELVHAIGEAYHHEVMDVYFTEFVMQ